MNPVDKQLAEAIVASIAAGLAAAPSPFAPFTFTPERKRLANLGLMGDTLRVWVVGSTQETDDAARDVDATDFGVSIGVLKKVSRETVDADVDGLVGLAEALRDWLRDHPLDGFELLKSSLSPTYDHNRLQSKNEFVSVVDCLYRFHRDREEDDE